MQPSEIHSALIREGLRKARANGKRVGGLRPGREELNRRSHLEALERVLEFRLVLEAGKGKTNNELSAALFAVGCKTKSGGRLPDQMVKRMRERLEEAKLAYADGLIEHKLVADEDWSPRDKEWSPKTAKKAKPKGKG